LESSDRLTKTEEDSEWHGSGTRRSRSSGVLQEAEAGTKVAELCRKYGISEATYYNWKTKYAGMTVSELRRLKTLEAENRRLKQIVAEQTLDMQTLKELLAKNF
jgi:putative transposase